MRSIKDSTRTQINQLRLLNFQTQERYYTKIVDRYMAYCASAGRGDELLRRMSELSITPQTPKPEVKKVPSTPPAKKALQGLAASRWADDSPYAPALPKTGLLTPSASSPAHFADLHNQKVQPPKFDHLKESSTILFSMRKLREGIVASHRIDAFSTQVYIFIIRLSILLKHAESYHPAILHLLNHIHPRRALTKLELQEFAKYLILDMACRRNQLAEAHRLRVRYKITDHKIKDVIDAVLHGDYHAFFKLKKQVDGHCRVLVEGAEADMRLHALKCFGQTYFSVEKGFLEQETGSTFDALKKDYKVGWEVAGEKVVIRIPKGK